MSLISLLFVAASAIIDILANLMAAKSRGFTQLKWGLCTILFVWLAFALLGQAVKTIDIAIAYAMWGAIGVLGTATMGRLVYGSRLRPIGWFGIATVSVAVVVLSTA